MNNCDKMDVYFIEGFMIYYNAGMLLTFMAPPAIVILGVLACAAYSSLYTARPARVL